MKSETQYVMQCLLDPLGRFAVSLPAVLWWKFLCPQHGFRNKICCPKCLFSNQAFKLIKDSMNCCTLLNGIELYCIQPIIEGSLDRKLAILVCRWDQYCSESFDRLTHENYWNLKVWSSLGRLWHCMVLSLQPDIRLRHPEIFPKIQRSEDGTDTEGGIEFLIVLSSQFLKSKTWWLCDFSPRQPSWCLLSGFLAAGLAAPPQVDASRRATTTTSIRKSQTLKHFETMQKNCVYKVCFHCSIPSIFSLPLYLWFSLTLYSSSSLSRLLQILPGQFFGDVSSLRACEELGPLQ